ncbi:MAG: MFS transporter [Betaproteobacteria bacterium]|nr:MAG: MFS transporter [Betaproteobacteria bacterium]
MIKTLLLKTVAAREEEAAPLLWATAYGFCIMFAYYVLRAVRDEISAADRGNLQYLWTAVFLAMLVIVPLYSWVSSRWQRGVFVPLVNRFFIANLVLFYAALVTLPEGARAWIDRVFYVWASVFALFAVTVFWGLMVDCFRNEQGKRLFGFIAVGSSLGAIAGSALTAALAQKLPPFTLLLVACVPLEAACWCAGVLHRRFGGDANAARVENRPLPGGAWTGIVTVFRSPYLLGIAGYILLMTYASTVLYFLQADLIRDALADRAARTALFAQIDLWSNTCTIMLQVFVAARVIRWIGVGATLMVLPLVTAVGFIWLGTYPQLTVLIALQVAYRALRYGLAKPTREVLFTVLGREEKYKSKAFLDAAIYRGGDLASGWIFTGLKALGLAAGSIALAAAPLAALWAVLALWLGRRQDQVAKIPQPTLEQGAGP